MITLQIFRDGLVDNSNKPYPFFEIQTYNKLNIVLGDSGSGKTYFMTVLRSALNGEDPWSYKCVDSTNREIRIATLTSVNDFNRTVGDDTVDLVVIDEDTTQALRKARILDSIDKINKYFILLDRGVKAKLYVNVNALYESEEVIFKGEKIIRFVRAIKLNKENITDSIHNKITHMITEDKTSGKVFWQNIMKGINVIECDSPGNGAIKRKILSILNETRGDILVALDYDRGSVEMQSIYEDKNIDKSRIHFIPLESFEEVICNSEFILDAFPQMRNKVKNYKECIDESFRSTGSYFNYLLYRYVKQKPPVDSKSITKFYSKGMKNFKECFMDDCCGFESTDCKLMTNKNKKESMLANKFIQYRIFL